MEQFKEMKEYARINEVPIMEDDGLQFLLDVIKEYNVSSILEIGTAIAYSAICMASLSKEINVVTIERDEVRYNEAVKNVEKYNFSDQIELIYGDALETKIEGEFDLIFIDAAKAQYIKFFEKYTPLLKEGGVVVSDNLDFHGMVSDKSKEMSRNVRQLVRKIQGYIDYLKSIDEFETEFYEIGDGIAVSKKREKH